jgi:hypothetical protein
MKVFAVLLYVAAVVWMIFLNWTNGLLMLIAGTLALGVEIIRNELRFQSEIKQAMAQDLAAIRKALKRMGKDE